MTDREESGRAQRPDTRVVGVVLAGGEGRRMGRDKTGLHLRKGERDFLGRTADLLTRVTNEVFVSCRPEHLERAARAGHPALPDIGRGGGAMRAVYSALERTRRPCLTVPCDMPFLTEGLLRALLDRREKAAERNPLATLYRRASTGYLQTLVAVYEPEALPWFRKALAEGVYGLYGVLPPDRREYLDYGESEEALFRNVNVPEELARARREAGKRK